MVIKFIFFFSIIVASAVQGRSKQIFVNVDPQIYMPFSAIFSKCTEKTGIDVQVVKNIAAWKLENDDIVKKFLYCLSKDSGYGDKNGHLVKEKIGNFVGNHPKRNDFDKTIDECNKSRGSDKYDTLFNTVVCVRDNSPILFRI